VDPAAAEVAARGGRRTLAWFEQHCAANGLDWPGGEAVITC
jgi:hypothetical protein